MKDNNSIFRFREKVSPSVIKRLPRYYRILCEQKNNGVVKISSTQLANISGTTASQIRQDFNHFGGFGQQGFGYNVDLLINEITKIIGIQNTHKAVLIGAGNIGKALIMQMNFCSCGFSLCGIFDKDSKLAGTTLNDIRIRDISELTSFCKINNIQAAILCMPTQSAPDIVKTLYESGVTNFWNFTHYDIKLDYPDAGVEDVHLSDSLMNLCFLISDK